MLEGVKLLNVNWTCLYVLIKVPVWFNSVLLIYPLYGLWKSLKSPWIWFWQMGKNHESSFIWQCIKPISLNETHRTSEDVLCRSRIWQANASTVQTNKHTVSCLQQIYRPNHTHGSLMIKTKLFRSKYPISQHSLFHLQSLSWIRLCCINYMFHQPTILQLL